MRKTNRILITAFEPFGGDLINPSELILDKLPNQIGGYHIEKLLLPVEFIKSKAIIISKYEEIGPDAVVMIGQAGGRSSISIEEVARNIMNANIPDNNGYLPKNVVIDENGKEELRSTLPIDRIIEKVNNNNIGIAKSNDAGTYVCNALFYSMLNYNKGIIPTGFIHIPYIKEQGHNDKPYMELDDIYNGIAQAISTVIDEIK